MRSEERVAGAHQYSDTVREYNNLKLLENCSSVIVRFHCGTGESHPGARLLKVRARVRVGNLFSHIRALELCLRVTKHLKALHKIFSATIIIIMVGKIALWTLD